MSLLYKCNENLAHINFTKFVHLTFPVCVCVCTHVVMLSNELTVIFYVCTDIKVLLPVRYAPINWLNMLNVESLKMNCSLDARSCAFARLFVQSI